jgi:hypothetical protein
MAAEKLGWTLEAVIAWAGRVGARSVYRATHGTAGNQAGNQPFKAEAAHAGEGCRR